MRCAVAGSVCAPKVIVPKERRETLSPVLGRVRYSTFTPLCRSNLISQPAAPALCAAEKIAPPRKVRQDKLERH